MNKKTFILLLCATLSLISCDKETTPETGDNPVVYVVGSMEAEDVRYATIWKDGVATALSNKTNDAEAATANSIYVDGNNDVYAAGYTVKEASKLIAKLWKNGTETNLTDGQEYDAMANSVCVAGGKVYVAGTQTGTGKSVATLWVDGVARKLSDDVTSGGANAVCAMGSDIYVAGYRDSKAVVWKNGVATELTDGTTQAQAESICVSGNDLYVVGYERKEQNGELNAIIKVWKNGVATNLTDGTAWVIPTSIFVSGNDVYVTGNEFGEQNETAKLWKNGVETTILSHATKKCRANSVYVKGSDVYVVLEESADLRTRTVKLWKNGIITNLTDGENDNSYASAIFVK